MLRAFTSLYLHLFLCPYPQTVNISLYEFQFQKNIFVYLR